MLTYLKLHNFRQFVEAEINFDDTSQITLISGRNGHGKSTILEAVKFAIWGVGRDSKTKLESLIRDGAEIEGLDVELRFTHAGHDYIVERHLEPGLHLSTLTMDGGVIEQGPIEVRKRMSRIFGMDVRGFSLATYATQDEINGLASQSRAKRVESVHKLARADVFTKTRDDARKSLNLAKNTLNKLGPEPDAAAAQVAAGVKKAELEATREALQDAKAAVEELEGQISAKSHVQEAFQAANKKAARAEGSLSAAQAALTSAEAELRNATVALGERPEVPEGDIDALQEEHDELVLQISRAEAAEASVKEIERLQAARDKWASMMETAQYAIEDSPALDDLKQQLTEANETSNQLAEERKTLTADRSTRTSTVAVLKNQIVHAQKSASNIQSLTGACPTCEQDITDAHKEKVAAEVEAELARLQQELAEAEAALQDLDEKLDRNNEETLNVSEEKSNINSQMSDLQQKHSDLTSATERFNEVTERLEAIAAPEDYDVTDLRERDQVVAREIRAIRAAETALRTWERQKNRKEEAERQVAAAAANLEEAEATYAEAAIPQSLMDQVDELSVLGEKLVAEKELVAECHTAVKVLEQQVTNAEELVKNIAKDIQRRDDLRNEIEVLDASAQLLASSATTISASIRPKMEGATSTLLAAMSGGKLDAVKLDRDYNIKVRRGGKFRDLIDLSGGERDLVGLAQRIGLAEVVAAANGATAPEMLILDEPFGSQDTGRRSAILDGLRGLRNKFPQILLVAHVENIEDLVDGVLHVESTPDPTGEGPDTAIVTPA